MMAAVPVSADVTTSSGSLGGIPVVNIEVAGAGLAAAVIADANGQQLLDRSFNLRRRRYGTSHGVGLLQSSART
jgi:hypothetical protein